jgi:ABC-type branched-subunit amino acid transport system substrate-binding protein
MKRALLFFLIFLCLVILSCKVKTPKETKIALVVPLSGPLAPWGKACEQAVRLGLEKQNIPLHLVTFDNEADITKTKEIFGNLTKNKEVIAVIGPLRCNCLEAVLPFVKKANFFVISPGCFKDFWFESKGLVLPLLDIKEEAKEIGRFLNKNDFSWAIFLEASTWSYALAKDLKETVKNKPIFIHSLKGQDISPVLPTLNKKSPQAIVVLATPITASLIIFQIKKQGFNPYFLGPHYLLDLELEKIIGGPDEKILIVTPTLPKKAQEEFYEAFLTRYHTSPAWIAVCAYAATKASLETLVLDQKSFRDHLIKKAFLQLRLSPLGERQ